MRRLITLMATMLLTCSLCMAGMTNSRLRKETRFLTDKMAYELNLTTAQYNDVYEINYDFIDGIRYVMDDVLLGFEWALDDYYTYLDLRNDDLRWVLSSYQYHRFMNTEHFFRPVCITGGDWLFRVHLFYTNVNHFFYGKPYHYRTSVGGHCRGHFGEPSFYRNRYDHPHYPTPVSIRQEKEFVTHRRSDFGSVNVRESTKQRPSSVATRLSSSARSSVSSRNNSSSSRSSATTTRTRNTTRSASGSRTESSRSSSTRSGSTTSTRTNSRTTQVRSGSGSTRSSSSTGTARSSSSRSSRSSDRSSRR